MGHRVVVVGSGFGGLFAVKALAKADVEVTLIDIGCGQGLDGEEAAEA